jgi:hypothetical protein
VVGNHDAGGCRRWWGVGEAVARKMTRGAVVEMGGHVATNGDSHTVATSFSFYRKVF